MFHEVFLPVDLEDLFKPEPGYPPVNDASHHIEMIQDLYRYVELNDIINLGYVGALLLVALESHCITRRYYREPLTHLPRLLPKLGWEMQREAQEIARAWKCSCSEGMVLLPIHVATAALQVKAQYWQKEIDRFTQTVGINYKNITLTEMLEDSTTNANLQGV